MKKIMLGKTGLMVGAASFGALPIQRLAKPEAVALVRAAYEGGFNYFDTANGYTDSEEKLGEALLGVRDRVVISSKSGGRDKKTVLAHIEQSLIRLKTDYIDIYQLHNPSSLPDTEDPNGPYAALLEARAKGYIRFIGISNHRADIGRAAVLSGAYDTLQFPFSSLASPEDISLAQLTHEHGMGFIAMKGLAGGLITNAASTFAFIRQYPFAVPIWGIQRQSELDEFLYLEEHPPRYSDVQAQIEKDRAELAGSFCHGCGYCMPCPMGIHIPTDARMGLLIKRAPLSRQYRKERFDNMQLIGTCIGCRKCASACPYGLDVPTLLKQNYDEYMAYYEAHQAELAPCYSKKD